MKITNREIAGLVKLIGLTEESEIDCDTCLHQVAEFAEHELMGKSIPQGLRLVEHHLLVCVECQEEYVLLKNALKGMDY